MNIEEYLSCILKMDFPKMIEYDLLCERRLEDLRKRWEEVEYAFKQYKQSVLMHGKTFGRYTNNWKRFHNEPMKRRSRF